MGSLWFLQPMRNGPMRPSMGYWASPTQNLFAQTHSMFEWLKQTTHHFHIIFIMFHRFLKRYLLYPRLAGKELHLNHLEPSWTHHFSVTRWWLDEGFLRTFPTNLFSLVGGSRRWPRHLGAGAQKSRALADCRELERTGGTTWDAGLGLSMWKLRIIPAKLDI